MLRPILQFSVSIAMAGAMVLAGCGTPNQENIELRKRNQDLTEQVNSLKTQNESRQRQIDALIKRSPELPSLPPGELKKLWITSGIVIGNLSGGARIDFRKTWDEGFQVYVCPTDENGERLQNAGAFEIEAFDLAEKDANYLGKWTWTASEAKKLWRSFLMEHDFVLVCPWKKPPRHPEITVRVKFIDELTHAAYTAETVVHVTLPDGSPAGPATSSAAAPTTAP